MKKKKKKKRKKRKLNLTKNLKSYQCDSYCFKNIAHLIFMFVISRNLDLHYHNLQDLTTTTIIWNRKKIKE